MTICIIFAFYLHLLYLIYIYNKRPLMVLGL
nr:MAG TPA: hypothetical protein [Caudoviricetes sp.]